MTTGLSITLAVAIVMFGVIGLLAIFMGKL